jgi:phage tail sheath protein FI
LWAELRRRVEALLERLWQMGALDGASSSETYTVRCDRGTMTDGDLDNGRLIVEVSFTASAPIERILVTLAMDESGQVSLLGSSGAAA